MAEQERNLRERVGEPLWKLLEVFEMENKTFDEWAIVELFGHKKMAGRVCEETIGGCSFVRIDVPKTKNAPAWSKLLGQGAIYGITITDENTAKLCAESYNPEPMDKWTVGHMIGQLPIPGVYGEGDTVEEDDDIPL